ncbi:MAG: hypothetical protein WDW38_004556 [Sanguina aurantia]
MGNIGSSPIYKAAIEGDVLAVRLAVQQHPTQIDTLEDTMGWSALHIAAHKGFDPIVRELLTRGARPNLQDKMGRAPLHLACAAGHMEVVKALLKAGAKRELRDQNGQSPYDFAAERHPPIAALVYPVANLVRDASHQAYPSAQPYVLATQPRPNPVPDQPYLVNASNAQQFTDVRPAGGAAAGLTWQQQQQQQQQQAARSDDWVSRLPSPPANPPGWQPYPEVPTAFTVHKPDIAPTYQQQQQQQRKQAVAARDGGWGTATAGSPGRSAQPPSHSASAAAAAAPQQAQHPAGTAPHRQTHDPRVMAAAVQSASAIPLPPAAPAPTPGRDDGPGKTGKEHLQDAVNQLGRLGMGLAQHVGQALAGARGRPSKEEEFLGMADMGAASAAYTGPAGRLYTRLQLAVATDNFSSTRLLGSGGYGAVYSGVLDGIPVAVKVMDTTGNSMQGVKEFESEAKILSRLHHPHIVLLVGSCPQHGMLVYELMEQGSLQDLLFKKGAKPIPWKDRVRIAAEVASALLFLHSAPEPIVHMDLKPANVLLDRNLTSKVGDVGLARLIPALAAPGSTPRSSMVQDSHTVGTLTYIDPEYYRSGQFSPRSDIYGLGMIMLQLLTGSSSASSVIQVETARRAPRIETFAAVLDPRAGGWPPAEAASFADLALKCVEMRRQDRPDLRDAVLPILLQLKIRTGMYDTPPSSPQPAHRSERLGRDSAPAMFVCPITLSMMDNPVFCSDGNTYEDSAIRSWISRTPVGTVPTSPMTGLPLTSSSVNQLVPNLNLRSAILEWKGQHLRQLQHH